jgi:hypothetical protein
MKFILKSILTFLTISLVLSNSLRTPGDELFGFKGMCLNGENVMKKLTPEKFLKKFPKISTFFTKVLEPLRTVVNQFKPSGCIGDFTLKDFLKNKNAQRANCNYFPLAEKEKMSTLAFSVQNIPCGAPVSVNFCSVFDKKGNFGFSISGGAIACFTAATGVGAVLSPIAEGAAFLQLGYSPDRKWTTKMTLLSGKDSNPHAKEFTLKSHLYLGGKMGLPEFKVKIGSHDFKDIFSGSMVGTFNVDFGKNNVFSIENMKKLFTETNKSNAMQKIRSLILPARETSFSVTANLKLNLEKITDGFLKEMNFNDAKIMMMISIPGVNGEKGSTSLPGGVYMTFTPPPNMIGEFLQPFINKITENFMKFKVEVKFPSLKNSKIALYIGKSLKLEINFPGISIKCIFKFEYSEAQCKTQGKVIDFFRKSGKLISKIVEENKNSFFSRFNIFTSNKLS